MTILAIVSVILATIIVAIGGWKLGVKNRREQSPNSPMAKVHSPKGIQATLDKQEVAIKPKKLPIPEQLTKEELEALAEDE